MYFDTSQTLLGKYNERYYYIEWILQKITFLTDPLVNFHTLQASTLQPSRKRDLRAETPWATPGRRLSILFLYCVIVIECSTGAATKSVPPEGFVASRAPTPREATWPLGLAISPAASGALGWPLELSSVFSSVH